MTSKDTLDYVLGADSPFSCLLWKADKGYIRSFLGDNGFEIFVCCNMRDVIQNGSRKFRYADPKPVDEGTTTSYYDWRLRGLGWGNDLVKSLIQAGDPNGESRLPQELALYFQAMVIYCQYYSCPNCDKTVSAQRTSNVQALTTSNAQNPYAITNTSSAYANAPAVSGMLAKWLVQRQILEQLEIDEPIISAAWETSLTTRDLFQPVILFLAHELQYSKVPNTDERLLNVWLHLAHQQSHFLRSEHRHKTGDRREHDGRYALDVNIRDAFNVVVKLAGSASLVKSSAAGIAALTVLQFKDPEFEAKALLTVLRRFLEVLHDRNEALDEDKC